MKLPDFLKEIKTALKQSVLLYPLEDNVVYPEVAVCTCIGYLLVSFSRGQWYPHAQVIVIVVVRGKMQGSGFLNLKIACETKIFLTLV